MAEQRPSDSTAPTEQEVDAQGTPPNRTLDDRAVAEIIADSERAIREYPGKISSAFSYYLHQLQRYPVLTPDEEYTLAKHAEEGDEDAKAALVRHNLRFVVTVARKYASSGVDIEDLVQEGNVGLLKAAEKFDPSVGVKFISYAVYWINQAIRAGLAEQQRAVRLPINRATQLARLRRALTQLTEKTGRMPSVAELARETEVPAPMVRALLRINQSNLRLDAPIPGDEGGTSMLGERIPSDEDVDETVESKVRGEEVQNALSQLRDRDAVILTLFFGLGGKREHTLEEIGQVLGITRERVRQIRDRALKELRHKGYASALEDYVGKRKGVQP